MTSDSTSFQAKTAPKPPTTSYIHGDGPWSPAGGYKSLETAKPLKQGVRIVDTLEVLTVNWLLGRLVNTLANTADGADSRR